MTTKAWIVTVSDTTPIDAVAKALAKAGLTKRQVLAEIGIVTGLADEADVAKLLRVSGVATVEPDTSIDIGPPDSSETW